MSEYDKVRETMRQMGELADLEDKGRKVRR